MKYIWGSTNLIKFIPKQNGDSEVILEDGSKLIFHYVQLLHHHQSKGDQLRRVWDPTYTMVYQDSSSMAEGGWSLSYVSQHLGSDRLPKSELIQHLQKKAQVCTVWSHDCHVIGYAPPPFCTSPPGSRSGS